MQTSEIDLPTLRRLSALRPDGAKVLTLYVNLDPREFSTPPARATELTSLLDESDRRVRDSELSHAERTALRADLERLRELLPTALPAEGAHGLAVFCSGPAGLLEVLKLPAPVPRRVCIDDSPWVEPLAPFADGEALVVALVNRRTARILRGTRRFLVECEVVRDDVHGQHDQGGWSQARYERSIDEEVADHLRRSTGALHAEYRRERYDRLVVGAPEELVSAFEQTLHPELRERLTGRIRVDVEHSRPDDVVAAVADLMREVDRAREREALERLREGLGRGTRAAAGLADVLAALHERRVEILLYAEGFSAPGVQCPRCGWLGAQADACPVDGGPVERRASILESAIESAVLQSAQVLIVREHDDLGPLGGIGAVLRF